jgi:hypothetical protein
VVSPRCAPVRRVANDRRLTVWLKAIGLLLGSLGVSVLFPQEWRDAHRPELGWMSQHWLAEHRAGSR